MENKKDLVEIKKWAYDLGFKNGNKFLKKNRDLEGWEWSDFWSIERDPEYKSYSKGYWEFIDKLEKSEIWNKEIWTEDEMSIQGEYIQGFEDAVNKRKSLSSAKDSFYLLSKKEKFQKKSDYEIEKYFSGIEEATEDIKKESIDMMKSVFGNIDITKGEIKYDGKYYVSIYFFKGDTYFILPKENESGNLVISNDILLELDKLNVFDKIEAEEIKELFNEILFNIIILQQRKIQSLAKVSIPGFAFGEGKESNRDAFEQIVKDIDNSMPKIISQEVRRVVLPSLVNERQLQIRN